MNAASPGTVSLTLKPRPSVNSRCELAWSVEPSTTCPSLRGCTRFSRSTQGARVSGRAMCPGVLYGGGGVSACTMRSATSTTTVTSVPAS